ncbi:MAG: DNA-binding response regulator [Dethiobacter sp.]|nr:MAG: DNA-binding response regulator [Dethiobacter sp.]
MDSSVKTILIVEDDEEIVGLLRFNLENQGYRVITAEEGYKAQELVEKLKPDLILLDIMLPGLDGYEVCRILRSNKELENIPIIMLTAKSEELDVVLGLELGADDYVTKPFSVRELLSRIKAHLRRNGKNKKDKADQLPTVDVLRVGEITLKTQEYKVYVKDKQVYLTHKEFQLLKFLMLNKGKVMKRDLLLERIWGYDTEIDTRTVDVHIRYLRQKIEENPAHPRYIETVRGVGYCFAIVESTEGEPFV